MTAAVLVGAPTFRVGLLGEALAPALAGSGLELDVVPCGELVERGAEPTPAGLAAALGERLATAGRPEVLIGDRAGVLLVAHVLAADPGAAGCAVLTGARRVPNALERLEAAELAAREGPVGARPLALLRAAGLLGPSRLADDTALAALLDRLRPWPEESAADVAVLTAAAAAELPAETLAAVTTRCLVLAAALDPVTSPHAARAVADALPEATLRSVQAGGGGAIDAPQPFGEEVGGFVESARVVP
ncbi:alpha/beta hydrolase [Qaidamihabitans albus]|uniref:alpha/beta hydrolase n=1 Tax=Qaidamihabitans albus TaxID=2795733 RepID=UPI0018F2185B|nr:alpha/beta hydrolase [Qaidamihabitans albus]